MVKRELPLFSTSHIIYIIAHQELLEIFHGLLLHVFIQNYGEYQNHHEHLVVGIVRDVVGGEEGGEVMRGCGT